MFLLITCVGATTSAQAKDVRLENTLSEQPTTLRSVITTYEGKHNHEVPAPRGSGNHSASRPLPNNAAMVIRPSTTSHYSNTNSLTNPTHNVRLPTSEGETRFTLEMLQTPGSFGFSGYGNSMNNYMGQTLKEDNGFFSRAKEEPRDDFIFESLLS